MQDLLTVPALRRWLATQTGAVFTARDLEGCPLARYLRAQGQAVSVWPDCLTLRTGEGRPLGEVDLPLWAAVYIRLVDMRRGEISREEALRLLDLTERWLRPSPRDLPLPPAAFQALLAERPEGCAGALPGGRAGFVALLRQVMEAQGLRVERLGRLTCQIRGADGRVRRYPLPVWARVLGLFWEADADRYRTVPVAQARAWLARLERGL